MLHLMTHEQILKQVNDFLISKNKPVIGMEDTLWTSGLLDSLDMFELVLYFDKMNTPINKANLTMKSVLIDLGGLDTIDSISKNLECNSHGFKIVPPT